MPFDQLKASIEGGNLGGGGRTVKGAQRPIQVSVRLLTLSNSPSTFTSTLLFSLLAQGAQRLIQAIYSQKCSLSGFYVVNVPGHSLLRMLVGFRVGAAGGLSITWPSFRYVSSSSYDMHVSMQSLPQLQVLFIE